MSAIKPHSYIMDATVYVAGEASIPGFENPAKLSSNESPLGASPKALEAFKDAGEQLERYPDGGASVLREAIAESYGLSADQIICSNGSEQLIDILTRAYAGPGDEVVFTEYGFIAYRIAAQVSGATPVAVAERDYTSDVNAILEVVNEKTRVVFIANPNNPTGTYITKDELKRLREGLPDRVLLVVDAAYAEYISQDDYSDGRELVENEKGNTVVLHTFSKIYGLAALRVGWAYCPKAVVDVLTRLRGVFNVSRPAQMAAIAALADSEHTLKAKQHNEHWLNYWLTEIPKLGLKVTPSVGNFVLIHFKDADQSKAVNQYLRSKGIIFRPVTGYGLPECLRASIGLEAENQKVIELLKGFMQQ